MARRPPKKTLAGEALEVRNEGLEHNASGLEELPGVERDRAGEVEHGLDDKALAEAVTRGDDLVNREARADEGLLDHEPHRDDGEQAVHSADVHPERSAEADVSLRSEPDDAEILRATHGGTEEAALVAEHAGPEKEFSAWMHHEDLGADGAAVREGDIAAGEAATEGLGFHGSEVVRPDPLESAEGGDHTAVHKAIEPVVGIRAVSKEESLADDLKQRAESRWARRLRHVFGTAEERSPLFYGVLIGLAILLLGVLAVVHFGISSFGFSLVEGVVVAMAVCGLIAALSLKHGVEDISVWTGWLLIYLAGGVVLQLVARPILRGHAADVWLCYTAMWAVLYLCRLRLRDWIRRRAEDRAEIHAVHAQARLHNARHEAKLKLLPGHGWYLLASRVTALAMVGSFATTAIGFYQEIVDPHDVALLRYSIPVGLSALAALIIWTGWDYVFRKLRTARIMMMRCLAWGIGCVVLIPMTVAIHSVFGVIGVGGTEGLRAHHMWYANVLSGSYDLADRVAKAEIAMRPQIELMRVKFEQSAERERKGGSGCGAGEGDLFRYYTDRGKDAAAILKLIDERQAAFGPQNDLAKAIETVKKRIRNPGRPFREAEAELGEAFKDLRTRILALESNSVKRSLEQFIAQLALVRNDRFFTGWAECQVRRKPAVQAEVESFLTEAQRSFAGMEQAILLARMEAAEKIPPEHRIDSVSALLGGRPSVGLARAVEAPRRTAEGASEVSDRRFVLANLANAQRSLDREPDEASQMVSADDRMVNIPTFISLRPFWAVASYAGQLPGYIALQAALDFSPAILGFLFAIMAPLAKRPDEQKRLG